MTAADPDDRRQLTAYYLASEVDARIAEHDKDWEEAAKERVQHLTRIAELEKAVNRGIEALSRCYDVTEWPADRGSFQLTVLNDLKSLMVSKPDAH